MNTPVLLEGFAAELVRRGLPVDYAESTAAELDDHYRDLFEESQAHGLGDVEAEISASERLGKRSVLVKKSVRGFQGRFWCARWPLVTFLLAPIPLWIVSFVGAALVMTGVNWCLGSLGIIESNPIHIAGSRAPLWFRCSIDVFLWVAIPALLTIGLAHLARRAALGCRWVTLVACVMAISAGSVRKEPIDPIMVSATGATHRIWICLPLIEPNWWQNTGWKRWYGGHPVQALQFFVPLIVAGAFLLRTQQLARRKGQLVINGDHFHGGKHEHARVA